MGSFFIFVPSNDNVIHSIIEINLSITLLNLIIKVYVDQNKINCISFRLQSLSWVSKRVVSL
jgi:hypothetical protein